MIWMLVLWVALSSAEAMAQGFMASTTGGYLCSTAPKWRYMQAPTVGIDVAWAIETDGSRRWQRWWKCPTMGVRANYTHVVEGIAGNRLGVVGFVQSPMWRSAWTSQACNRSKHQIYWEYDVGFSVYGKPYERIPNDANDFIGTYLNCMLQLGVGYRGTLSSRGDAVQIAAKIVHTSNGQLTHHNQGLNYLQCELGYCFAPSSGVAQQTTPKSLSDTTLNRWTSALFVAYAPSIVMSRYSENSNNYYYAHTAQMGYKLHRNECLALGVSADLMYNYSHPELYTAFGIDYRQHYYLGMSAFIEPRWDRISMRAGLGWYLFGLRSSLVDTPYYERFGIFYHLGSRRQHTIGVAMKLHKARIDYIEWTYAVDIYRQRH